MKTIFSSFLPPTFQFIANNTRVSILRISKVQIQCAIAQISMKLGNFFCFEFHVNRGWFICLSCIWIRSACIAWCAVAVIGYSWHCRGSSWCRAHEQPSASQNLIQLHRRGWRSGPTASIGSHGFAALCRVIRCQVFSCKTTSTLSNSLFLLSLSHSHTHIEVRKGRERVSLRSGRRRRLEQHPPGVWAL